MFGYNLESQMRVRITLWLGLAATPAAGESNLAITPYNPILNGCTEKVQNTRKLNVLKAWSIRTDGGPEFTAEFMSDLMEQRITHEKTAGFLPNGKAIRD